MVTRRGMRGTAPRLGATLAALFLAGGLTACSGGGGGEPSMADAVQAEGGGVAAPAGPSAGDTADRAASGANRTVVRAKAVIKTGQIAITSDHLDETRDEVDQLLFGFGGSIDSEETSHDRKGHIERSTLVLRVPADTFKPAMTALGKLGKVKTSDSRSKNVTTEVIDVDQRVLTLQTSLDRLHDYQAESADVDELLRLEDQITDREGELQSLKAQQAYLADQTSMSTITVYLSTPDKYVPPPDALKDAGFLTGLKSGWDALTDTVVVALTVVGALLPFAIALALAGVPTWLLVRTLTRRRQVAPAAPSDADADVG